MAALRAQADPSRVTFVGHRSGAELAELFSNAYAFVLPSHLEGMSMALLEALAFGLPALVSDIAENRAVVPDRDAHFAPRDPAGLRRRLAGLIDQPDRVAALARRQATLHKPDWRTVALRYDELYRSATRRHVRHAVRMADVAGE